MMTTEEEVREVEPSIQDVESNDEILATDVDDSHPNYGEVKIHNNVIAVIARLAALKIPGVVDLSGGFVGGLADMIGKKGKDRGIRVEVTEQGVELEMNIIVEYGQRIPQVAWQLQRDVKAAIEQMTGKPVNVLNVVVQGVKMPGEKVAVKEEEVSE